MENEKWYVGSEEGESWMERVLEGNMCEWTRKYRPKEISLIYNGCSIFDIYPRLLLQMDMFGIDNVRGGVFTNVVLDKHEESILRKMLGEVHVEKRWNNLYFIPLVVGSLLLWRWYR